MDTCLLYVALWNYCTPTQLKPPLVPSRTQVNTANLTSTANGLNDHDIKDIEVHTYL